MPFINPALIRLLLRQRGTYAAVVPYLDGKPEPLFALYSKDCLPAMLGQLLGRDLRMGSLINRLRVRRISAREIDRLDPRHLSFFNVNTEEDLKKAGQILSRDRAIFP
jgi:molybdopterin-guanine dinucleotide biosynthesis protein A